MKSRIILAGIFLIIALEGVRYISILGSGRFGPGEAILSAVAVISLIGLEGIRRQNKKILYIIGGLIIIMSLIGLLAIGRIYIILGLILIIGISIWKKSINTSRFIVWLSLISAVIMTVLSYFVMTFPVYSEVLAGQPLSEPIYTGNLNPFPLILSIFPAFALIGIYLKEGKIIWMSTISMFLLCGLLVFSYGLGYLPVLVLLVLGGMFFDDYKEGVPE